MEHFHYLIAVDNWLQQPYIVLFLQVSQLFAHHTEVLKEHLFPYLVLRRDISLAQRHQVFYVLARIVQ